ncbi:glycogen synthase [Ilumatobacter coccineus]|uniref:Glycogen synthase n=1 Tax=Ilumatobacter coccineus (strain NBRC 103263 / KCTC 29153 / YM16-304) TaxID=1313172 RepID=A0A6C7EAQ8_ILUCY|nr:glycogen/starch synthase [Ilumatobacter coccineus]BAN02205.1 glycogen synthase [Ilumatobacter coccineus YM16-304]
MRVLFATAELSPVATVGGLAAAAAGLGAELRRSGVDLDLVMPDYGDIALVDETTVELDVPDWVGAAVARQGRHPAVGPLTLIGVPGMARPHPYLQPDGAGWPDNAERFFRFARAVAAYCERTQPDVLHLNDWHTGAALAALDDPPPSVVSIHNLAYQGVADGAWLDRIGLNASHYEWWGDTNPLSGALALADRIVAVSPNYSGEIQTAANGFGLDGPLRNRADALVGILNGIDTDVWNPATDPHIAANYDAATLDAKQASRDALVERFGWSAEGGDAPIATVVTRLTEQKGIDLLVPLIPLLDQIPMRLAILGSGDAVLASRLAELAARFPDVFAFVDGYDETLSHLLFAGGDLFLVPSRFEPCGLTQMQAMRYGTIPVVTAVGGLVDTVPDADASPTGVGFVAAEVSSEHLLAALFRAARRVTNKRRRTALQKRMMSIDHSWTAPAAEYAALYDELVAERG